MPYISIDQRKKYDKVHKSISSLKNIETKGDLEYLIFTLMCKYISGREANYSNLHDTTYAAQHCSDEFRRRFLDERENYAKDKNGDILI